MEPVHSNERVVPSEQLNGQLCEPWHNVGVRSGVPPWNLLAGTFGYIMSWILAIVASASTSHILLGDWPFPLEAIAVSLAIYVGIEALARFRNWGMRSQVTAFFLIFLILAQEGFPLMAYALTGICWSLLYHIYEKAIIFYGTVGAYLLTLIVDPSAYSTRTWAYLRFGSAILALGGSLVGIAWALTPLGPKLHAHFGRHDSTFISNSLPSILILLGLISGYIQNRHIIHLSHIKKKPLLQKLGLPNVVNEADIHVAHISDIHLSNEETTSEGQESPDAKFRAICGSTELRQCNTILITGDITDAGLPGEWRQFFQCMPNDLMSRLVLVPGNHDVAIVSKDRRRVEDVDA